MWGSISANIISDPCTIANILNNCFNFVFTNEQNNLNIPVIDLNLIAPAMEPIGNNHFGDKHWNSLNYVCKTGGLNDIPAKVLKLFAYFLTPSLIFPYKVFYTQYYHLIGKMLKLFQQLKRMILSVPKITNLDYIVDKHMFKIARTRYVYIPCYLYKLEVTTHCLINHKQELTHSFCPSAIS